MSVLELCDREIAAVGLDATVGEAINKMLDREGEIGVLAPGALADIIAVPGDPLKDIKQLGNVQFVIKDGQVFRGR